VLAISSTTIRLFLHVLAATIWVGGQLTLAGLIPVLRSAGVEVPRMVARRFNLIAWPAFAVLVLTGIWNVAAERDLLHGEYQVTKPSRVALSGALSGLAALAALFLGIMLTG